MAYIVELFEAAENELEDAIEWYLSENISVALRFSDAYESILDRLEENPFQFPVIIENIRKTRFVEPFPFNVFFAFENGIVHIISVFHDKRDPKIWQARI